MSEDGRTQRAGAERTASSVGAIAALPRLLGSALEDVRAIARGMQILPDLARTLAAIQRGVESMDEEVRKMRRAVESMSGDVERLHPRLDELQRSIPLSRIRRWRRPVLEQREATEEPVEKS